MNILQSSHDLLSYLLYSSEVEVLGILAFHVESVSFVKVILQQLRDNYKMLFMIEVVVVFQDMLLVDIAVVVDVRQ
jgi:hypothetical protein